MPSLLSKTVFIYKCELSVTFFLCSYSWVEPNPRRAHACIGLGTNAMSDFVPAAEMLQPNQIAAFKC